MVSISTLRTWPGAAILLLSTLALSGCEKDPEPVPPECTAGSSSACTCPDGQAGTRMCAATGTWMSCMCMVACVPDCSALECGVESKCGTNCGACNANELCTNGQCELDCTNTCSGRECGLDPMCGTACGTCDNGEICSEGTGTCVEVGLIVRGKTPLLNARVTATIGATELETTANANGDFQIGISIDDAEAVLILRAYGTGGQTSAAMASVVGSVGELATLAGSDEVVDELEHRGLVISSFSTSVYAALRSLNDERPPATRAELDTATLDLGEHISAFNMLDTVTLVQAVSENMFALAPPYVTVLDFLEDSTAFLQFARDEAWMFPELAALLDPVLTRRDEQFNFEDDIAPQFDGLVLEGAGFAGAGSGQWEFSQDGSGIYQPGFSYQLVPVEPFNFVVANGKALIIFDRFVPNVGFGDFTVDEVIALINDPQLEAPIRNALGSGLVPPVQKELGSAEILPLYRRGGITWVMVIGRMRLRFDLLLAQFNITAPAVERDERFSHTIWQKKSDVQFQPFTREELIGEWALRLVVPSPHDGIDWDMRGLPILSSTFVELREDGMVDVHDGSVTLLGWSLSNEGRLVLTYADGAEQTFAKWAELNGTHALMTWYRSSAGETVIHYYRDAKIDPGFRLTPDFLFTMDNDYWQTSTNVYLAPIRADGVVPEPYRFGFTFERTLVSKFIASFDFEGGFYTFEPDDRWSLTEDMTGVSIELRRDSNLMARCPEGEVSCISERRRNWHQVAARDDVLVVVEEESWISGLSLNAYRWDAPTQTWIHRDSGMTLDTTERRYIFPPRVTAYFKRPLP